MKVLGASRAAAHQAGHTCSYSSSLPLRSRFFLKGCLHCASHSSSISISLPFTGPRCRADGGVWQTFPVPDSLLCSGSPAVPAAISPSGLCQGIRLCVLARTWCGTGPKTESTGCKPQPARTLTCGSMVFLLPPSVLLVVASFQHPADYADSKKKINEQLSKQQNETLKKKKPQNLQICSPHPPSSHLEITNNHLALCASQEPQTSKKRPGFFLCSAQRIKNTHREKHTATKVKICSLTLCGRILSAIFLLLALEREGEKDREKEGKESMLLW